MALRSRLVSRCLLFAALMILAAPVPAFALTAPDGLEALDERDDEVLEAIAARKPDEREAALVATQHPDTLVRIQLIQARSSAAFQERANRLERARQEQLWEIVRAPGLLTELTTDAPKSREQLEAIAAKRPEALRKPIVDFGTEHAGLLQEIEAIQVKANDEFREEISTLPEPSRAAFDRLLEDPELLAMLGQSPTAVFAIGKAFENDPAATRAHLDELAVAVAASKSQVEEQWRESLENDPEAAEELESAAREYANEYGYDYEELTDERVDVVVRYVYTPYPYWFGYPYWYAYWQPWGWWYPVYPHFGFYYGPYGGRFYVGLPSVHFVHWYYGGNYHRYGHLSKHFDSGRYHGSRWKHPTYRTVGHYDRSSVRGDRRGYRDGTVRRSFGREDGRRVFGDTRSGDSRRQRGGDTADRSRRALSRDGTRSGDDAGRVSRRTGTGLGDRNSGGIGTADRQRGDRSVGSSRGDRSAGSSRGDRSVGSSRGDSRGQTFRSNQSSRERLDAARSQMKRGTRSNSDFGRSGLRSGSSGWPGRSGISSDRGSRGSRSIGGGSRGMGGGRSMGGGRGQGTSRGGRSGGR